MDREERQRIYLLLHQFYPRARQLQTPETLTAWGYILENYTYEDVKKKILKYAASNKYFPDIADITGDLTPVEEPREVHEMDASRSVHFVKWLEQQEEEKRREEASGGPCQIRKLWDSDRNAGENMMEGMFLRRHYPEACDGCRRMAVGGGCTQAIIARHIDRERENCLIIKGHSGEGKQADILKKYWRELCPLCCAPHCFWFETMKKESAT
jgi:hypothetical protein